MDSTPAKSSPQSSHSPAATVRRQLLRGRLRETFESLPLAAQFRVTPIAAVTATLAIVMLVAAIWDTRVARDAAPELAHVKADSMAERFEAAGGGALENLEGHPEILAATYQLEG